MPAIYCLTGLAMDSSILPLLQACLRRSLESIRVWRDALSDVESTLTARDALQRSVEAMRQMTTLQNATAWAELRRETEEDLASVLQV